jgi:hypothetical protein
VCDSSVFVSFAEQILAIDELQPTAPQIAEFQSQALKLLLGGIGGQAD